MKIEINIKNNKKSLGQNFLTDKNIVKKIVNLTKISNNNILEIGPGYGFLTDAIIKKKPKSLLLIEKDYDLYQFLKKKYEKYKFIKIINQDILNFKFKNSNRYKVISNLPYNISRKILLKTFILNDYFDETIFMIQKELAVKFDLTKNKINKYNFYTSICGDFKIIFDVSPNVFYPKPKVTSSVIRFKHKKNKINKKKLNFFFENFFINKRKKIKSNNIFLNFIDKKYINHRYENLNFNDVLKIYQSFEFRIS